MRSIDIYDVWGLNHSNVKGRKAIAIGMELKFGSLESASTHASNAPLNEAVPC